MGKMNGTTKDPVRQSRNQSRKAEFTTEVTKSTKVLVGCAARTAQFVARMERSNIRVLLLEEICASRENFQA
jgi:hypothetical protein